MSSTIVLAAGGTGGHIFPAEAVASALVKKGYKVIFITDKAGRKFEKLPAAVQVMVLPMHRRSKHVWKLIKFAWGILRSIYHVYRGFKVFKPDLVMGFGGYPSFPAVMVAQLMKIPTLLHEQNALLGQVNRLLSRKARHVALSFEHTDKVDLRVPLTVTGLPVREKFYDFMDIKYEIPEGNSPVRILITGGSQGAHVFSVILPKALEKISENLRHRLSILHQCPHNDMDALKKKYEELSINAEVVTFINNMAEEILKAHLVIARSGASTLAELAILGRPAILVPFPSAKDDHQWLNAQAIEKVKGGWCIRQHEFSADYLSHQLEFLTENPELLYDASNQIRHFGQSNATQLIISIIESELKQRIPS